MADNAVMSEQSLEAGELVRAALSDLGVGKGTLSDHQRARLDEDGFVVLDSLVSGPALDRLNGHIEAGLVDARTDPSWSPGGTLHLDGLFDRGPDFDRIWTAAPLLAAVEHLLGDQIQVRGLHYRGPQPGFGAQLLHQDFGHRDPSDPVSGAVALVALSPFTGENGATRVVPGSHRSWEFSAPSTMDTRHADEVQVLLPAGSVLVMNGHLWHSGVRNRSALRRDALQLRFVRRGTDPDFYPDVDSLTLDRLGSAAYLLL